MRIYRSILNDVLGPIMTGPSSSHCAGCCQIGLATRQLYGKDIEYAEVIFDEAGSYPNTYIGQGSNYGFTGGLLGFAMDDPRLKDAISLAKQMRKKILFHQENLGGFHPNQAEIRIYEGDTLAMKVMTFSIGGGMFQIKALDEFNVLIEGTQFQYFIYFKGVDITTLQNELTTRHFKYEYQNNIVTGRSLICINSHKDILRSIENMVENIDGVVCIRSVAPVVPNVKNGHQTPCFFNASEALLYSKENDRNTWQLCEDYECSYGFISTDGIHTQIQRIRLAMEESMTLVDPNMTKRYGFLPYQAKKMKGSATHTTTVNIGFLEEAIFSAISVLENSCAHNIIVAAPTAGSSGVIPASIITVGRMMGKTDKDIEKALMAAGVVGVFIANQATFGGEVGACQAEIGSACAMASAGVIDLLGGTIKQCFSAASLALQNMLGLICDPIAGLTEIPCISRNVVAVSNAVMSANMVMMGFDQVVPLDEVIQTMGEVGKVLPSELRCTCKGGLCNTKTGRQIAEKITRKKKEE